MGLCLFFWPNFPGATFIQGGTLIPDSRVSNTKRKPAKTAKSELWNILTYRSLNYIFEVGSHWFRLIKKKENE